MGLQGLAICWAAVVPCRWLRDTRQLHSRPAYHGWLVALLAALPSLGLLVLGGLARPLVPGVPARRPAAPAAALLALAGLAVGLPHLARLSRPDAVERVIGLLLIMCS